ncbi:MAG: sugar ABC transporter permease [Pseudomonadota bacterium]
MDDRLKLGLKLAPLLLPFLAVFAGGFLLAVAQSFGYLAPIPVHQGRLAGYAALFNDSRFWGSFGFSLYVSFFSGLVPVLIGTPLAFLIWKLPPVLRPFAIVYKIPLALPHLTVAFLVLIMWTQSGVISSLCARLGLIGGQSDFPALLFAGNGLGLIAAYGYKGTSFVILMVYAVLQRLDRRLPAAATMLGASRVDVFFRVVLPHVKPAAHTSFIILFLYAFGAFDIPYLLSESSPGMLSIRAYDLYFQRGLDHRPEAMAVLTVMFVFSALFIHAHNRLNAKLESRERKL